MIPTLATATDNLVRIAFLLLGKSTILTGIIVLPPAVIVQFGVSAAAAPDAGLASFRILRHVNARHERNMPKIAFEARVRFLRRYLGASAKGSGIRRTTVSTCVCAG